MMKRRTWWSRSRSRRLLITTLTTGSHGSIELLKRAEISTRIFGDSSSVIP